MSCRTKSHVLGLIETTKNKRLPVSSEKGKRRKGIESMDHLDSPRVGDLEIVPAAWGVGDVAQHDHGVGGG